MSTPILVANERTCWHCGHPIGECICQPVQNEYGYGDDDDDDLDDGDEEDDDEDDDENGDEEDEDLEPEEDDAMTLTEERPLGTPTWDFSPPKPAPTANQRKQPAPTVRQQYPLVANQGEETPLGCPTWNFAPAGDCPDDSEQLVANDDAETPMPIRTLF